MFTKTLKTALVGTMTGKRRLRKARPSLEQLDVRIAPTGGFNRLMPALPVHSIATAESRPFVMTPPAVETTARSQLLGDRGTEPGHIIPDFGSVNR